MIFSKSKKLFAAVAVTTLVAGLGTSSKALAATCMQGTYSNGSSGTCVQDIQYMLNTENTYLHYGGSTLSVDGQFGPLTKGQVKVFQGFTGLVQDGVVGSHTWGALCSEAASIYFGTPITHGTAALYDTARSAGCQI